MTFGDSGAFQSRSVFAKLCWSKTGLGAFDTSPVCFDSKITQGGGDRLLKDSEPANLSSHYFFKGQGKWREDIVCVVLCV